MQLERSLLPHKNHMCQKVQVFIFLKILNIKLSICYLANACREWTERGHGDHMASDQRKQTCRPRVPTLPHAGLRGQKRPWHQTMCLQASRRPRCAEDKSDHWPVARVELVMLRT